jgi:hypothetical protein
MSSNLIRGILILLLIGCDNPTPIEVQLQSTTSTLTSQWNYVASTTYINNGGLSINCTYSTTLNLTQVDTVITGTFNWSDGACVTTLVDSTIHFTDSGSVSGIIKQNNITLTFSPYWSQTSISRGGINATDIGSYSNSTGLGNLTGSIVLFGNPVVPSGSIYFQPIFGTWEIVRL